MSTNGSPFSEAPSPSTARTTAASTISSSHLEMTPLRARLNVLTNDRYDMLWSLRVLGITLATMFPDLDGLAKDLDHLL